MKKLTYLVIATAALGMVACTGNKAGYVITGTVEGALTATLFTFRKQQAEILQN